MQRMFLMHGQDKKGNVLCHHFISTYLIDGLN